MVSEPSLDLRNTDCMAGLDSLPDLSVDVAVTSPPYNLGVKYSTYNDSGSRPDYLAWMAAVMTKLKQKLRDDGSVFLNVGSSPTNPWGPFEILSALRPILELQNNIVWVKSIYIENQTDGNEVALGVGHYQPLNSKRFLNDTHEYVFHLTKTGKVPINRLAIGVPYSHPENASRWANGGGGTRCRGNSWYVPYPTVTSNDRDRPHPASFPVELAEMCIKLHRLPADRSLRVLDPFMGIGSTALAAQRFGVDCIGFEIDPEYYAESLSRVEQKPSMEREW